MSQVASDAGPNIFPALKYKDAPGAIDWLGRAFGFEKNMAITNPDDSVAHAELTLGGGTIMLGSKRPPTGDNPWDGVDQGIYVFVVDVDAHHARAKEAGAEIVRDLADTDYGSREYSVRDPEGYLWSFGTYRP